MPSLYNNLESVSIAFIMQYDTVEKAVKSALNKFGKIDILVNCKSSSYIV